MLFSLVAKLGMRSAYQDALATYAGTNLISPFTIAFPDPRDSVASKLPSNEA